MADGNRPEVAGGTTSGKFCESVVVKLCIKFGDPRTSSFLIDWCLMIRHILVVNIRQCAIIKIISFRWCRIKEHYLASAPPVEMEENN